MADLLASGPAECSTPGRPLVLRGLRIWNDGEGRFAESPGFIRISGQRIEQVGLGEGPTEGGEVLDFANSFALPGLIDGHVHIGVDPSRGVAAQAADPRDERWKAMRARAAAMLRAGITTARDLGGPDELELALRDAIGRGEIAGPRLLCAGQPVTTPGGHCHFWGGAAANADEALAVVERQIERGVDWIKVMATGGVATQGTSPAASQFSAAELARLVARARDEGRRVAAHCHGTEGIRNAALARVGSIEHCSFAGADGFGSALDARVVGEVAASGAWVSPTINAGWARRERDANGSTPFFERMSRVHRALDAAGAAFVASTDAGIPGVPHDRLVDGLCAFERYAGISPARVVRAATGDAALAIGLAGEVGRIAAGASADLLIVADDPLLDLGVLRTPRAVFARGRRVDLSLAPD